MRKRGTEKKIKELVIQVYVAAYAPTKMDLLIIKRKKTDDEKNEEEYRRR